MQKFYVMGDIHNHVDSAQSFLDYEKPERVIWLGDFTDNVGDGPRELEKTGRWLNSMLKSRPNDIVIQSNHELAYRFPVTDKYKICGWTSEKHEAFHQYFDSKLWERFVIAHREVWNGQEVLFSHAGMNRKFFPNGQYDFSFLQRTSKIAFENGNKEDYNPLLDDWSLGPMWMRWQNFAVLQGACQVVGHTTHSVPQIRRSVGLEEWNLCLDCAHSFYAVFKDKNAYAIDRHRGYERLLRFS